MPGLTALAPSLEDALQAIRDHLKHMRFGSIAITVHDGRIVQIDITEKKRLAR